MPTVYLNIGSNQGDRHALIEQAVALIAQAYPQARLRRSSFIESEPWGFDSDNMFLNLGIALDFIESPDPISVLDRLQAIEHSVGHNPHRNTDGTYRDRLLDIDIIAIDDLRIETPRLTLPHKYARERAFVMLPLVELMFGPIEPNAS